MMRKIAKKNYFYDWHRSEEELPTTNTLVIGWMWIGEGPQIPFWLTALYDPTTQKFYTNYADGWREIDLIWWAIPREGKLKR